MKKMVNGIVSDMTADEEAVVEASRIKFDDDLTAVNAAVQAKKNQLATDKATGNQKLLDLGLTQDEVDSLLTPTQIAEVKKIPVPE